MNQKEIGKRIKTIRESQGLTREEFAQKLNVSIHTVANYEQGQRGSNMKVLNKIAEALGVPIFDLIGEEYTNAMKDFTDNWNNKSATEKDILIAKTKEKWEVEGKETIINTIINIADKADTIDFFLNEDNTINYEKSKQMFDIFVNTMRLICDNSNGNR